MEKREQEYFNLILQARNLNRDEGKIKADKEINRKKLAALMHEDKINEKLIIMDDGEPWRAYYQDRKTSTLNEEELIQLIGQSKFDSLFSTKKTTSLTVRKAAADKTDNASKTSQKPVDVDSILNQKPIVPGGSILS
jgi:arsenate reductase-like glutaredoxin family protein